MQLYVNQYSSYLGKLGRKAIVSMFDKANKLNLIPSTEKKIFLI